MIYIAILACFLLFTISLEVSAVAGELKKLRQERQVKPDTIFRDRIVEKPVIIENRGFPYE